MTKTGQKQPSIDDTPMTQNIDLWQGMIIAGDAPPLIALE
jgi:hypothetical protein